MTEPSEAEPIDPGLVGKVAIVTGGGAAGEGIGNGRAAAILLARDGAHVLVVDRELALAERTAAMIEELGGTGHACQADVTEEADCRSMVASAWSAGAASTCSSTTWAWEAGARWSRRRPSAGSG